MEAKHTPGEWSQHPNVRGGINIRCPWGIICAVHSGRMFEPGSPTIAEQRANARLISAAPELLEALQRVMDLDCPMTGNPSHAQLVEFWEYEKTQGRGEADDRLFALAAIAKATT